METPEILGSQMEKAMQKSALSGRFSNNIDPEEQHAPNIKGILITVQKLFRGKSA